MKEEQRHSAYLLRFMQREGIPVSSKHWVDTVFRRLRVLGGLELALRVLVSAEIIAIPYYRALGAATQSPLLQAICATILQDEAAHLRFQASMLWRLSASQASYRRSHRFRDPSIIPVRYVPGSLVPTPPGLSRSRVRAWRIPRGNALGIR